MLLVASLAVWRPIRPLMVTLYLMMHPGANYRCGRQWRQWRQGGAVQPDQPEGFLQQRCRQDLPNAHVLNAIYLGRSAGPRGFCDGHTDVAHPGHCDVNVWPIAPAFC